VTSDEAPWRRACRSVATHRSRGLRPRWRAAIVVVVALSALDAADGVAASSPLPTGLACASPQARVDAALDGVHFPWRALGYRYVAAPPRADLLALTFTGAQRRTEVYVQPCAIEPDALLRHVIAHEVAHAIDAEWMTPGRRTAWTRARRLAPGTAWYACDRCPVWSSGEGDFAEVFALWQTGAFAGYASAPTLTQLPCLVRLFPRRAPTVHPRPRRPMLTSSCS